MARPIQLTKAMTKELRKQFDEYLKGVKDPGTFLNFKISFDAFTKKDKATIYFDPQAYNKMRALVNNCDLEIAWHGLVDRIDDITFYIKDVLMYPQKATSATVESNDDKYPIWIMERTDDEINTMRFQGHSHVNMGVSPSAVDLANWNAFLESLNTNDYYIFCINNKANAFTWKLFDLKTNTAYDTTDLNIIVGIPGQQDTNAWAKEVIKDNLTRPAAYNSLYTQTNPTGYYDGRGATSQYQPSQLTFATNHNVKAMDGASIRPAADFKTLAERIASI